MPSSKSKPPPTDPSAEFLSHLKTRTFRVSWSLEDCLKELNLQETPVSTKPGKKDSFEVRLADECLNGIAGLQFLAKTRAGSVVNPDVARAIESLSNAVLNLYSASALRREIDESHDAEKEDAERSLEG